MLYGAVTKAADWPDGFEELAYVARNLSQYGYTVVLEKKMFAYDGPDCRFVIVHWEHHNDPRSWERKTIRTEIGTYDSHDETVAMVRFLIGVERDKRNERN